jgi:hypothetical protein
MAHCKDTIPKNSKQIFPEKELCGLSPNIHIHVTVSDLHIPRINPHIWLQQNMWSDPGYICINITKIDERRNWETEHYNSALEITRLHSFISGIT